jgi:cell division protein FtsN
MAVRSPNIIQTSHSYQRIEGQGTTGNTEHGMHPQDTRHWPQIQHDITPVTAEAEVTTESAQEITHPTPQEDTREATSSTQTVDADARPAEGTPR